MAKQERAEAPPPHPTKPAPFPYRTFFRSALPLLFLLLSLLPVLVPSRPTTTLATLLQPLREGASVEGFTWISLRRAHNGTALLDFRSTAPESSSQIELLVVPREENNTAENTRSFSVDWEVGPTTASPEQAALLRRVVANALRANDPGSLTLATLPLDSQEQLPRKVSVLQNVQGLRGIVFSVCLLLFVWGCAEVSFRWVLLSSLAWVVLVALRVSSLLHGHHYNVSLPCIGWLALAAVLLLSLRDSKPLLAPLAIALFGFLLRLSFGLYAPLRVNGLGPMWIQGAFDAPEELVHYGPGYREWFGLVSRMPLLAPDTSIFLLNALLSSTIILSGYFLANRLLPAQALPFAFLLAINPLAVRASSTEGYWVAIAASAAAAMVALLRWKDLQKSSSARAWGWATVSGILMVTAARVHPVAWTPLALVPLVLLTDAEIPLHKRALSVSRIAALWGALLLATSSSVLAQVLQGIESGALMRPGYAPWRAVLPCFLLLFLCWRERKRSSFALLAVSTVHTAIWFSLRDNYGQNDVWRACFDQPYLLLPLLSLLVLHTSHRRMAAFVLGWLLYGAVLLQRTPNTEQREYRELRRWLLALPPQCSVVHLRSAERASVRIADYLFGSQRQIRVRGMDRWENHLSNELASGCWYYLRTSLCATREGAPQCEAFEARLPTRTEERRIEFPAISSVDREPYVRSPIRVVLFRLR